MEGELVASSLEKAMTLAVAKICMITGLQEPSGKSCLLKHVLLRVKRTSAFGCEGAMPWYLLTILEVTNAAMIISSISV